MTKRKYLGVPTRVAESVACWCDSLGQDQPAGPADRVSARDTRRLIGYLGDLLSQLAPRASAKSRRQLMRDCVAMARAEVIQHERELTIRRQALAVLERACRD
jgi:hypothetical protein